MKTRSRLTVLAWVILATYSFDAPASLFSEEVVPWNSRATRANWWRATRDYNTKYHPWKPPESRQAWERAAEQLRERILISQGLWPLPERTALQPVVHGKTDCGDYTIEKVFFTSRPGVYVTGNLYRPQGGSGKKPGVLSPHGHWADGRFYDAGEKQAEAQREAGAESHLAAARSPIQARMVHLARMGCVVFHYDMIGNADNTFLHHTADFTTPADALWLLESMGLQTWNSWRALDFLAGLDDVDPERIVMTGASGGGTQTFMLSALDERVKIAVPAVMVSTDMQGGCICENAPYLRIDTNNVAIAALFAPRPLGLIGANDWTLRIATRGLPELRQIYGYYDQADLVQAWVHPEFGHNYNEVSRRYMYQWFADKLSLEGAETVERDFERKTAAELTVFNEEHPRPTDALKAADLRQAWIEAGQRTLEAWATQEAADDYERTVSAASRVLLGGPIPEASDLLVSRLGPEESGSQQENAAAYLVSRRDDGHTVPVLVRQPANPTGKGVFWFSREGLARADSSEPQSRADIEALLAEGSVLVTADIYATGLNRPGGEQPLPSVNSRYYGYTHGYNLPLISEQVRDIRSVVVGLRQELDLREIVLIGTGEMGAPVLLAQSSLSPSVTETVVELPRGLNDVRELDDPLFLPGASKYGGLGGLAGLHPVPRIAIHLAPAAVQHELRQLTLRGKEVRFVDAPVRFARETTE
ncbi:MAG: acetylxylan esterase [Planctomycetaceae bacterium]|nr:acetylxylan esterase [Planctomycetaceae bacterium]